MCFPSVKFEKCLKTPTAKNTCEQLLLSVLKRNALIHPFLIDFIFCFIFTLFLLQNIKTELEQSCVKYNY